MNVSQIMTVGVRAIDGQRSIREAAELLRDRDIGMLAVAQGDRVVGVVTDRDLSLRAVARGCPPETTPVRDVMSSDPLHCYIDQDLGEVGRLMSERQVRRVLVYDRYDRPVGVLSLSDLAASIGNADLATEILQEISKPAA